MLLNPKWKNKYPIHWCNLCDTAVITCPACRNSSCNGSSCPECHEDSVEFSKLKTCVENYLSPAEVKVYQKAIRIRAHILDTLGRDMKEINWEELGVTGHLSEHDMIHVAGWSPEKVKEISEQYEKSKK